jgi:hypothetical protein
MRCPVQARIRSTRRAEGADGIDVILALLVVLAQSPQGQSTQPSVPRLGVEFDKNGWPVDAGRPAQSASTRKDDKPVVVVPQPAPMGESKPIAAEAPAQSAPSAPSATTSFASSLGSAGEPALFRSLGVVRLQWRIRLFGSDGAVLAERDVVQLTDTADPERERLEFSDGRIYARVNGRVQAQRHGVPWPTLEPQAAEELDRFALHARFPWVLCDAAKFVAVPTVPSSDPADRGASRWRFQAASGADSVGPPIVGAVVPFVEVVAADPTAGMSELRHGVTGSSITRRARLEDWREVHGLRIPFRRSYLDEQGKKNCVLELTAFEPGVDSKTASFRLQ